MEKENSALGGGGGGDTTATTVAGATSTPEKLQADQANPLLDPSALFGGKLIHSSIVLWRKKKNLFSCKSSHNFHFNCASIVKLSE